ncbi:MAG TPA: hypothetical protein VFB36_14890, partial [Nevskiaceae bacterium]|nr:hypothetical protein [Nevskiaceae bacterium]
MSFHPYTRSARARHACALAAATCLASLLSGCGNSEMAAVPSTHRAGGGSLELLSAPVSLQGVSVADSVVSMDVAVDVVVVGFPRETAQQLADALTPDSMLQVPYSDPRTLSTGTFAPGWFAPRAIYRVTYAPQSLADAYHDALQVGADGKHSDGNAAEAWLTQALADAGFIADPARPAVVLLHQGNASPGYAYDYGNGWLAPVRVLGAGNLIVMDLSAEADPFVGTGQPYGAPLALEDPSVVDALRAGARDAAAFRLMQGTLYVPSMKPCHALTVLAAKRMTATDGAPGYPVDAAQLERTFAALTGDPVFVDVKEITLPIDDPALDAFTRLISDGVPVNGTPARPDQVAREWIERNWASYHVPHEGCEEYLTLALSGDAADVQGRGTAEFDDGGGHRFAYTMVTNACALEEQLGVDVLGGCGSRVGVDEYRVPNALITHESGHLFGLRHPHDIEFPGGGGRQNMTFSSLATSMSYEEDDR